MALSSRVINIEMTVFLEDDGGRLHLAMLAKRIEKACDAAFQSLKDHDIPAAKVQWQYRYAYRSNLPMGSGELPRVLVRKVARRVAKRVAS